MNYKNGIDYKKLIIVFIISFFTNLNAMELEPFQKGNLHLTKRDFLKNKKIIREHHKRDFYVLVLLKDTSTLSQTTLSLIPDAKNNILLKYVDVTTPHWLTISQPLYFNMVQEQKIAITCLKQMLDHNNGVNTLIIPKKAHTLLQKTFNESQQNNSYNLSITNFAISSERHSENDLISIENNNSIIIPYHYPKTDGSIWKMSKIKYGEMVRNGIGVGLLCGISSLIGCVYFAAPTTLIYLPVGICSGIGFLLQCLQSYLNNAKKRRELTGLYSSAFIKLSIKKMKPNLFSYYKSTCE